MENVVTFPAGRRTIRQRVEQSSREQSASIGEVRPARDILLEFADTLEGHADALDREFGLDAGEIVDDLVGMVAAVRAWLE